MRFAGKLHTWHEDRGFGFLRPAEGGQDIFVHVSALPKPRPAADEMLTFEVALNAEGKKKAVNVRRQAVEVAGLAADRLRSGRGAERRHGDPNGGQPSFPAWLQALIVLVIVSLLAAAGYQHFQQARTRASGEGARRAGAPLADLPSASTRFRCDGRTHCSQMTSCEEATWFLANCPAVQMDGNGDGVPCELQWCGR